MIRFVIPPMIYAMRVDALISGVLMIYARIGEARLIHVRILARASINCVDCLTHLDCLDCLDDSHFQPCHD